MNVRRPEVSHVEVRDGWILGAGTLDELAGWGPHEIDDRFADKAIIPGLVEGHCHSREGSGWDETYVGLHDRMAPDRVAHSGLESPAAMRPLDARIGRRLRCFREVGAAPNARSSVRQNFQVPG